jgi:O-acetyl-ADP-ribose deacetylase (regulator of RNase III)
VALRAIKNFLEKEKRSQKVYTVLFSEQNFNVYLAAAKQIF